MSTLHANTPVGLWHTVALKHLVLSIQTGPFRSQLHAEDYSPGGRPVIKPAHLRDGQIEPDSDSAIDDDTFGRLSQHELREGDVVIGRRGELGRCGVVTRDQARLALRNGEYSRPARYVQAAFFVASLAACLDWLA